MRRLAPLLACALALPIVGCATGDAPGTGRRVDAGGSALDAARSVDAGRPRDDAGRPPPGVDAGRPTPGMDAGRPGVDAGPADECRPGETTPCTTRCATTGQRACVGGAFGTCEPPAEICDGTDDDCDGVADDGFECARDATRACTTTCGTAGVATCGGDCRLGPCAAPAETCNGVDDDCVGGIDDGAPCPAGQACRDGRCVATTWVFEAESSAMGHEIGRREGDGWSASTAADPAGVLVFGPYTRDIPAGRHEARFRLMVDNRDADNGVVVVIEVNDFDGRAETCGDCVIASRSVRRMEFSGTMSYQDFTLTFDAPGAGHRLEFRTRWTDISYVREDRITVRTL